ncbi:MAG: hypothetical protein JRH20_19470 [Deltaproteobacteria bacterium]|nr:hypothetical protein [Deltaproteobacteria bacterium]
MFGQRLVTMVAIATLCLTAACGDDDGPSQVDSGVDITVISDGISLDGEMADTTVDGTESDTTDVDAAQTDAINNDTLGSDTTSDTTTPQPDQATAGPSAKILEARTADGTVSILIEGVYVTYVKAARGDDPAGFFIQYEQAGPALFIAVDATTLTPVPAAGDLVTLTITEMAAAQGRREATAISDLAVTSSNNSLTGLVQEVTDTADLITALDSYDAELIALDGTITGDFDAAGNGFVSAAMDTTALTGETDIKLRLPHGLQQTLGIGNGCTFSLKGTPLWRYNTQAQPSAGVEADIEVKTCPAPKVISATALSTTTVRVTFDREIAPASVNTNGDQFTFDNSLTASAATVSGTDVELTTSAQVQGTTYTVTVATTVTDVLSTALDAAANTATFAGFEAGAKLLINELNVNVTNGCDVAELRVIKGGSLNGYTLLYRGTVALTFPDMVVAKNDYIVVHFDANDTKCYATLPADESAAKDEQPTSTYSFNYDTAFDLFSTRALGGTTGVITIVDVADQIVDALLYSDAASTAATSTLDAADVVAAANQWTPVGAAARTSYDATTYSEDAAKDVDATGTEIADPSFQRSGDTDTNTKDDWAESVASSWGANNAGQSDL